MDHIMFLYYDMLCHDEPQWDPQTSLQRASTWKAPQHHVREAQLGLGTAEKREESEGKLKGKYDSKGKKEGGRFGI